VSLRANRAHSRDKGTERSSDRFRQNGKWSRPWPNVGRPHDHARPRPEKAAARQRRRNHRRSDGQQVTRESDALDLKRGVFKLTSAKKIAASLKRSAEHSSRRKTGAYRSALSMLTFYINRAGKTLPKTQRARLERAKVELRHQFGRE
jgi:hypothetical protein